MSITYVEILNDSREIETTPSSTRQRIVIEFKLPLKEDDSGDLEDPEFDSVKGLFLGEEDDVLALETAYSIIPFYKWMPNSSGTPLLMMLDNLSVRQVTNHDWWRAEANYVFDLNSGRGGVGGGAQGDPETDKTLPFVKIGFRTGGETSRITESITTYDPRSRIGGTRSIPETGRAIGVTADTVEGTDVYSGPLALQLTAYYYPNVLNFQFINQLAALFKPKGRAVTNNGFFLGYGRGEVLLTSLEGGATIGEVVPITFNLIIKKGTEGFDPDNPTAGTGDVDEGFPNLKAGGHDVVDYRYVREFSETAQTQVQRPEFRFVHRVYDEADFTVLGFPDSVYANPNPP